MRASGIVSLALLTGVVVLGIATVKRWRPGRSPRFVTASVHRSVSLLAVVFVAIHVVTAVFDPYAMVGVAGVFVPFLAGQNALRIGLGALSLDVTAAMVVTSLLRRHVGARLWRGIHLLAYLSWPLALAHSLGSATDAGSSWLQVGAAASIALVCASVVWRLWQLDAGKHLEPVPERMLIGRPKVAL